MEAAGYEAPVARRGRGAKGEEQQARQDALVVRLATWLQTCTQCVYVCVCVMCKHACVLTQREHTQVSDIEDDLLIVRGGEKQ